jgi:hypothetical protein
LSAPDPDTLPHSFLVYSFADIRYDTSTVIMGDDQRIAGPIPQSLASLAIRWIYPGEMDAYENFTRLGRWIWEIADFKNVSSAPVALVECSLHHCPLEVVARPRPKVDMLIFPAARE